MSPHQLQHKIDTCIELIIYFHNKESLRNLITGDEKRVLCANYTCKYQGLGVGDNGVVTLKDDLYLRKIMSGVLWSARSTVHWEMLPTSSAVSTDLYC